jgi:DNA-binding NtrC family response regulator
VSAGRGVCVRNRDRDPRDASRRAAGRWFDTVWYPSSELVTSADAFDLVLTDSAMPGMRGEDLAAEITRIQPGLPVI